jgi:hypothetical protein
MRYFRIFDEISDPQGDLYKWDGTDLVMQMYSGEYSDHTDQLRAGETIEEMMTFLAGVNGEWEEVDGPA